MHICHMQGIAWVDVNECEGSLTLLHRCRKLYYDQIGIKVPKIAKVELPTPFTTPTEKKLKD